MMRSTCCVALLVLASCTTYHHVSKDDDGTIYLTYGRNYLLWSTAGVLECASEPGRLSCVDLDVARGGDPYRIRTERAAVTTSNALATGADHLVADDGPAAPASRPRAALHSAVAEGNARVVDVVLGTGCDINERNALGMTPLHVATIKGHVEIVRALLDRGALVNEKDDRGRTALHYAAAANRRDIADLLAAKGALNTAVDLSGSTPAELWPTP